MTLEDYEKLNWRYEYCSSMGAYLLLNPEGRVVWVDYSFTAPPSHILKMIEKFK
jgi:hypothetical protein